MFLSKRSINPVLKSSTLNRARARTMHISRYLLGKSIDNTSILINPTTTNTTMQPTIPMSSASIHQALLRQQLQLQMISKPIDKSDVYTQLPEDSQFITQHYNELVEFKEQHLEVMDPPLQYKDFNKPNDLIAEVSEFIKQKKGVEEEERWLKFLHNLKITLKLNGGYCFVLDVLLANKKCFDDVEKKNKEKKKKKD